MTTPTDTEMIRDVAEGLGWKPYALGYRVGDSVVNLEAETGLLAFATYVLAAMAKRGWWFRHERRHDGKAEIQGVNTASNLLFCDHQAAYDPTDPASWAMAVIRCAWEALKETQR